MTELRRIGLWPLSESDTLRDIREKLRRFQCPGDFLDRNYHYVSIVDAAIRRIRYATLDLRKLIYGEKNEEDSEVDAPDTESESETNEDSDGVDDEDDIGDESFDNCDPKSSEYSFEDNFDSSLENGSGADWRRSWP